MGAIVELGQRVSVGLVELANFNTRSTHTLKQIFLHLRAADPVDQHVDFDTDPRTLGQCAGESLAYITRPINIGPEIDGVFSCLDGPQHGRENLLAIEQFADLVSRNYAGAEQTAHGARELLVSNAVEVRQLQLDRCLPVKEIQREDCKECSGREDR